MAEPKKVKIVLNDIKKPLKNQRDQLVNGLKVHGKSLSLAERIKYEKAIVAMTFAHALLAKVHCVPTDMSLEMPPPSPPNSARARARARARKGGKKR